MVGEGVLHECLLHRDVEKVLVINRKPCGVIHSKLTEIIHKDFYDLSQVSGQLIGYNACFFCLGVTSVGKKEPEYYALTYTLTMHMAEILAKQNPDMTICYVSGAGTDSSEKGKMMWARVKGKTENDLMKLPFKAAFAFRPGFLQPTKGLIRTQKAYVVLKPLIPLLRVLFPKFIGSLKELGLAMINCVLMGYDKKVLEVEDIRKLSKRE